MSSKIRLIVLISVLILTSTYYYTSQTYSQTHQTKQTIPVTKHSASFAFNTLNDNIHIVEPKKDNLTIINSKDHTTVAAITVGKEPERVAISNKHNLALTTNYKDGTVSIADIKNYTEKSRIKVGKAPLWIAMDEKESKAYIANSNEPTISAIDIIKETEEGKIQTPTNPAGIAIDPNLRLLLILNEKKTSTTQTTDGEVTKATKKMHHVTVIDLNTNSTAGSIPVGNIHASKETDPLDINPVTHTAVVVNCLDDTITVIDLSTLAGRTIKVCKDPTSVKINELNNHALILCEKEKKLQETDLNTDTVVAEYKIQKGAKSLALNHSKNIAGVLDKKGETIEIIELQNPVPTLTIITPDTYPLNTGNRKMDIEGDSFIRQTEVTINTSPATIITPVYKDHQNLETEVPTSIINKSGKYALTLTNPQPGGGTSDPQDLTIENPTPQITALAPSTAPAGSSALKVQIHGSGFITDTKIYLNNQEKSYTPISDKQAEVELTQTELQNPGQLEIKATNPAPGGGTGNAVIFNITSTLTIDITTPTDGSKVSTKEIEVKGTIQSTYAIATVTVNSTPATVSGTGYTAKIPLTPGQNTITATVTDINGNQATKSITITYEPVLTISITTPADGATVNSTPVTVAGTVTSDNGIKEVRVNAIQATLTGNSYEATVPLTKGSNTITATAEDQSGNIATAGITITYQPPITPPPVTPDSGYINGTVYDSRTDTPLEGALVTVTGEPGTIVTDNKGFYTYPVSTYPQGMTAKEVLLTAEKQGYTYGQKRVIVETKKDTIKEEIYLVPKDTQTTTITEQGGTAVNSRGNIYLEFPAGAVTTPIQVNVTEYDATKELPGPLPPTSKFTFAADFLPDGAVFEKPVRLKVANFLGFPADTPVPVGYYDKGKGVWIADGMGVISSDGQWMEYDITHFTPIDLNFATLCLTCEKPPGGQGDGGNNGGGDNGGGCGGGGSGGGAGGGGTGGGGTGGGGTGGGGTQAKDFPASSVVLKTGALNLEHSTPSYRVNGEDFNLTLQYNTETINPYVFIGATTDFSQMEGFLPQYLKAELIFSGEKKTGYFSLTKDKLAFRGLFEKKDVRGNQLATGLYPYKAELISMRTQAYYAVTNLFGGFPLGTVLPVPFREPGPQKVTVSGEVLVNNNREIHYGQGWNIKGLKKIIKNNDQLIMTDNEETDVFYDLFIKTEVNHTAQLVCHIYTNQDAYTAVIGSVTKLATDDQGNIYIPDWRCNTVHKLDTSGKINTIAGTTARGYNGDNIPASQATLAEPKGIAIDKEGNIYIADTVNRRIRKIDVNGIITTVAGTGQLGYTGDGYLAVEAKLANPHDVQLDTEGNIYIADTNNNRIRRVDIRGIIETIAGTGQSGDRFDGPSLGDGNLARNAKLHYPTGLAFDKEGNLYVADTYHSRIRRIDPEGIITTVAGTGEHGYNGDEIVATDAAVNYPRGIEADQDNNIYIADTYNNRIRKIDSEGIITTLIGDVRTYSTQSEIPATDSGIRDPDGIAINSAGDMYIGEYSLRRVRKLYKSSDTGTQGVKSGKNNGTILTINSDTSYTVTYKDGRTLNFTPQGLQSTETDSNGNTTEYHYDTDGKLTGITDPAGGITTLTYSNNNLSRITDPQGRETIVQINADNDLQSITSPDGTTTQYSYDTNHRMTGKTLPGNKQYAYTYDTYGAIKTVTLADGTQKNYKPGITRGLINEITSDITNLAPAVLYKDTFSEVTDQAGNTKTYKTDNNGWSLEKTDQKGRLTTYKRDKNSRPLEITQPDGSTITYTYDKKGNILTKTDTNNHTTTYTYDSTHNKVKTITDPKGVITTFEYDTKGNLIKTRDPLGNQTTYTYDTKGLLTRVTDPNGKRTTYEYDTTGNLIKTTDPLNHTTTYTRDSRGNITTTTDAEGNQTIYEYDIMNRMTKTTDPTGAVTTYTYTTGCTQGCSAGSMLSTITDTEGKSTTFEYDGMDRQTKITHPDSTHITMSYDPKGNLKSRTDENGNTTTYEYDTTDTLIKITDPEGGTTTYTYDLNNNLTTVTDPNGNTTTYQYDSEGQLLSTQSPDTGTTTYTYDQNNNLKSKKDANNTEITYQYDTINRLKAINYPDPTEDIGYTYDNCPNGKGRLCEMTDQTGRTNYEYDPKGQTMKETTEIGATTYTTGYDYTPTGQLSEITYPNGRTTTYTYLTNRLDKVETAKDGITTPLITNLTYTALSLPEAITQGNNITTQMSYDQRNMLASLTAGTLKELTYSRDNTGNITGITDNLNPTKTKTYQYDQLYRLTTATGPWGSISYGYDKAGNRETETTDTGITNYTYTANQLQTSTGEKPYTFSYDQTGNTIQENTRDYTYNHNQRLVKAEENGVTLGEYGYNGNGQRVTKKAGSKTTHYHYSLTGELAGESTETGQMEITYVYYYGQPLAKIENDAIYYYQNDHLGTPMMMTDIDGSVVWEGEFKPFGEEISISGAITNNLRFPGQFWDGETGFHYNYFRDYMPEIGRYTEPDTIGIMKGRNHIYTYVANNPVNYTDPSGQLRWCVRAYFTDYFMCISLTESESPDIYVIENAPCTFNCFFKEGEWEQLQVPEEEQNNNVCSYE